MRHLLYIFLLLTPLAVWAGADVPQTEVPQLDTMIFVDKVQVTAIKQGLTLHNKPTAASVIGRRTIERQGIEALKSISDIVPNLLIPDYGSRMTSSIYVRGLGARIDQPVMGLNIDNVPVLNKDNYDLDMGDLERIEVLRGPQSTLYGRNTMGGVINVYTLSPLSYQGQRLTLEYGSGNTLKIRASSYNKLSDRFAMSVSGFYNYSDGLFINNYTGEKCDWERLGGGRMKFQWRKANGVSIDNTLSFSVLNQGGYPYVFVDTGEISYNDPCSYSRTTATDGLTVRYDAEKFSVSSITSFQYSDDKMILDQDFRPISYFTLKQARRSYAVTEDVVFKSNEDKAYRWLVGAFGFYRHDNMNAPVLFKQDGIYNLILKNANQHDPSYEYAWGSDELLLESNFRTPSIGAALYHESNYILGRWQFTAGIRIDYETSQLKYHNAMNADYTKTYREDGTKYPLNIRIDNNDKLRNSFTEVLPKASIMFNINSSNNLYVSVSKGYKAGGFNTQMFSDVLQQKMMKIMGFGTAYDIEDVVTYKPEKSWNYELGGHFSIAKGTVRADFALFWIDCRNQQITIFPSGTTTGRMMANAGKSRSFGGEFAVQASPWRHLEINASYGYTNTKFVEYKSGLLDKTGQAIDYKGKYIPYAPQNTLSGRADYTIPIGWRWLSNLVLHAGIHGVGTIYWNEHNDIKQPFYTLIDASVRFEHGKYSVDVWGRNLGGTVYDTFYFESIGNSFVQRGRPRTFGITLNITL